MTRCGRHLPTLIALPLVLAAPASFSQETPGGEPDVSARGPGPAHSFDHLVIGISDLDAGAARVAELTGVEPVFGGEHPHTGTHNALAALGEGSYLEIVAPRPGAETAGSQLATWVAAIDQLTPILWAISTTDAQATRADLASAGFGTSEPRPGSRQTPEGGVLEWRVFGLATPELAAAPFFIEWGASTPHPATTSPAGCRLTRLEVTSNDNAAMRRLLAALGVEAWVVDGPRPALRAELSCPNGLVELGAPAG